MYEEFCERHPALIYAYGLFIGCYSAVQETWCAWFFLCITIGVLGGKSTYRLWLCAIALALCCSIWVSNSYLLPHVGVEGVEGWGDARITSLSIRSGHQGKRYVYRGLLENFYENSQKKGSIAKKIPFSFSLPIHQAQEISTQGDYLVRGRLYSPSPYSYILKLSSIDDLAFSKPSFSWATWRFHCKSIVQELVKLRYTDETVSSLLIGLTTGELDDSVLRMNFDRLGVQHILAISGFHFAILATFLQTLLRRVLAPRLLATTLILLLSSYYLFIGEGPSIQRAWIFSLVSLIGLLLSRQTSSLNTLGVALIFVLLWDPLSCIRPGFYYSFIATGAILLLSPLINTWVGCWMPCRSLRRLVDMPGLDQHIYVLLSFVRSALSITIAVHIALLPLLILETHRFALWGVFANLVLPFYISFALLLFIVGALFDSFLPFLGSGVHNLNASLLGILTDWIANCPLSTDFIVYSRGYPSWLAACYLWGITLWVVYQYQKRQGFLELRQRWDFL